MRGRDNLSGITATGFYYMFLFPGMVIQWVNYFFVAGVGWSQRVEQSRRARSPVWTHLYAFGFWAVISIFLIIPFFAVLSALIIGFFSDIFGWFDAQYLALTDWFDNLTRPLLDFIQSLVPDAFEADLEEHSQESPGDKGNSSSSSKDQ